MMAHMCTVMCRMCTAQVHRRCAQDTRYTALHLPEPTTFPQPYTLHLRSKPAPSSQAPQTITMTPLHPAMANEPCHKTCIFSLTPQQASRELVELLRINTVIRGVSNTLGISMEERKRLFAGAARKGLPPRSLRAPHVHAHFNSLAYRVRLGAVLGAWGVAVGVRQGALRAWSCVLGLVGDVLFVD